MGRPRKRRSNEPTITAAELAVFKEVTSGGRGRKVKPETVRKLRSNLKDIQSKHKAMLARDQKVARDLRKIEKALTQIEKDIRKERRDLAQARRKVKRRPPRKMAKGYY